MASYGQVIGGHYMGATVDTNFRGDVALQSGFKKLPKLTPEFVNRWFEVAQEARGGAAGAVGAVGQAVAGAVLPGFIGKAASAALGATIDHTVRAPRVIRVEWVDGNESLIKLPEKLFTHLEVMLKAQKVTIQEPATAGAAVASPQFDFASHMTQLAALRDQGILTEDEFAAKKSELLARI